MNTALRTSLSSAQRAFGTFGILGAGLALAPTASAQGPACDGVPYCVSTPNSTGLPALMESNGQCDLADGAFQLRATNVPNGFGMFLYSAGQTNGGLGLTFGNGFRCVGTLDDRVQRLPLRQVTGNALELDVDFDTLPAHMRIAAGSTWNFQAWFRDGAAGGAGFDLSNGLTVTFATARVEFAGDTTTLDEDHGGTSVRVELSAPAEEDVTVPYHLAGPAQVNQDFTIAPFPLVVRAGETHADLTVTPIADGVVEGPETFTITLEPPTGADLGARVDHVVTLLDPLAVESDDFNAPNLDLGRWTFVDPAGDGRLRLVGAGTADARLELVAAGGSDHEAWQTNRTVRVMQAVEDADLGLDVKFENPLSQSYQEQGLVFEQDEYNFLRFEFYHDGNDLHVFASRTVGGTPTALYDAIVASGPWDGTQGLLMRVERSGDQWTQSWALEGGSWQPAAVFTRAMVLTSAGPYAGNAGSGGASAPEHTAVIDYVFDSTQSLAGEDASAEGADATAPFVYRAGGISRGSSVAELEWKSDEAAGGRLEYGRTSAYELGTYTTVTPAYEQLVTVSGLDASSTYFFRVVSEDGFGNASSAEGLSVDTAPEGHTGAPILDVWYAGQNPAGDAVRRFGHLGDPQTYANILGNVHDLEGSVQSLTYTLNGGAESSLSMGTSAPTPYRLTGVGDFNVELDTALLIDGTNDVLLRATDDEGNVATRLVRVEYDAGNTWPLPHTVDWKTAATIEDAGQVVDGLWNLEDDPLHPGESIVRPALQGYDRLIDIGDLSWTNYEIHTTLTVNELDPNGFTQGSNSYAVGIILRWSGHTPDGTGQQPQAGFYPFGGLLAYRWYPNREEWHHYGTNFAPNRTSTQNPLAIGVTYEMRAQVQSRADGSTDYRLRVWQEGTQEPGHWFLTATHVAGHGNASGSLLLLSNHVDASFGNVEITPLPVGP